MNTNKKDLFGSPLFEFVIQEKDKLNPILKRDIQKLVDESTGVNRSNQNGWHSESHLFKRKENSFRLLSKAIVDCVLLATKEIVPDFDPRQFDIKAEGWMNLSGKGAYNSPHDHPSFMWSGVYYVAIPENRKERSGLIEFLDPRTNILANAPEFASSWYFCPKVTITPKEGVMLIFPSYLRHWVYPNEEDENRISIAFNIKFSKKVETS